MQHRYAYVYVLDAPYQIDKRYVYRITSEIKVTLKVGDLCVVPFGNSNRSQTAVIVELADSCDFPSVKPIFDVLEYPVSITEEIVELCKFIKERFFCSFGAALKAVLPPGIGIRSQTYWKALDFDRTDLNEKGALLYDELVNGEVCETDLVCKFGDEVVPALKALMRIGAVTKVTAVKKSVNEKLLTVFRIKKNEDGLYPDPQSFRGEKQRQIIEFLHGGGCMSVADGEELYGATRSVFTMLEKKGAIERFTLRIDRDPFTPLCDEKYKDYTLSDEQKKAFDGISKLIDSGEAKAGLLFGVTGSGKTKVIIEACKKCIEDGKTAIVLLPEIGLTAQALGIYKTVFGDSLTVMHSMLSNGERIDGYRRALDGKTKIVIGTRSAIFAPLKNLGMIVIDEEQESTYRSDMTPKYHARDIARFRCAYNKCLMLLCSATPSVESYFKAEQGVYSLFNLENRYGGLSLPSVEIVDIRGDSQILEGKHIGKVLANEIHSALKNGKQVILFASRRGYSTHLSCQMCGHVFSCPNCSVSLTYHAYGNYGRKNKLVCHYCGYSYDKPKVCPTCKSDHIGYFGCGTQKLGEELKELFPTARAVRMDADSTSEKNSHHEIIDAFSKGEYDILYGTQMVAKGLDFSGVSLVGVVNADASLFMNDFRAGERAFSLITQLVGRSGRSQNGKAMIQTNVPDNEILRLAARQDYKKFYDSEIVLRKSVVFPPYCDIAVVSYITETEEDAERISVSLTAYISNYVTANYSGVPMIFLGPYRNSIYKLKNKYIQRLIIKYRDSSVSRKCLADMYLELLKKAPPMVKIDIDVNQTIV